MHKVTYLNDEEMQDVVGGSTTQALGGVIGRALGGLGSFGSVVASESSLGRSFGSLANVLTGPYYNTRYNQYQVLPANATTIPGFSGVGFRLDLSTVNVFLGGSKVIADVNGTGFGLFLR